MAGGAGRSSSLRRPAESLLQLLQPRHDRLQATVERRGQRRRVTGRRRVSLRAQVEVASQRGGDGAAGDPQFGAEPAQHLPGRAIRLGDQA